MAALRPPGGGDPVTDCTGAELKDGSLVEDDMFGQGFARGLVACVGGGFNFMRWEKYGWQVWKITAAITSSTPQLFKKYNYRVVWADNSKGPTKLSVDSYAFGESARLNSWVILKAKQA